MLYPHLVNIFINLLISLVFSGPTCFSFDLVSWLFSRIQISCWEHLLDFHLVLLRRILPSRASLLLLILLWALCLFVSVILLCSVTMLVLLATFWVTCLCYTLLSQCLLDVHQYGHIATEFEPLNLCDLFDSVQINCKYYFLYASKELPYCRPIHVLL